MRYSILPVEHIDIWDRYKSAEAQRWDAQEVDLSKDKFDRLSDREQDVLKQILAFFVVSDGIVNENLADNVCPEINIPEATFFYDYQRYNENVHNETYGLLIDSYIKDPVERDKMFSPIEHMETVKKKAQWALDWIGEDSSLEEKIISFACVEGLAFQVLFSYVFYFRDKEFMQGLCQANELILKDEQSHYEFAVHMYKNHLKKIDADTIKKIIMSCYDVEVTFIKETLGVGLPGLSPEMMNQFLQFVTDRVLVDFGLPREFNVTQPLAYMDKVLMETRSNFFEAKSGTYTQVTRSETKFDEDF